MVIPPKLYYYHSNYHGFCISTEFTITCYSLLLSTVKGALHGAMVGPTVSAQPVPVGPTGHPLFT